jgi:hypothetical protein
MFLVMVLVAGSARESYPVGIFDYETLRKKFNIATVDGVELTVDGVELSDLLGAVELFSEKQLNLSLKDLIIMKTITQRAFKNGHR